MTYVDVQVADYDAVGAPEPDDIIIVASSLSALLTQELDGACAELGVTVGDLLLTTLARTFARTLGEGTTSVDMAADGRIRCALTCVGPRDMPASDMLKHTHDLLSAAALRQLVHGVAEVTPTPETLLTWGVADQEWGGHLLELHVARVGDVVTLDWHYDMRSFDPYTIQELAEQFPLALIELTSEATALELTAVELVMSH